MPRLMKFQKNAVVYFEGTKDSRIFILQKGKVLLSWKDIEIDKPSSEIVKPGEFFGEIDALADNPRREKAVTLEDSAAVCLTIKEFQDAFGKNRDVMYKMLKKFSRRLRTLNKLVEKILHTDKPFLRINEMFITAERFYKEQKWRTCAELCACYRKLGASGIVLEKLTKMERESRQNLEANEGDSNNYLEDSEILSTFTNETNKYFSLPGFEKFSKKYKKGSVIIAEFEPGNTFYVLQSGVVQLTKCVNGTNINLNFLAPGEIFGEMAILDSSPRNASCIAMTDIEVLEFDKQSFPFLIGGNAQITLMILKIFCKRMNKQTRRLRIIARSENAAKIADLFLMLDERNSLVQFGNSMKIFSLSEEEIARWTGISVDAVKEELKEMRRSGIVSGTGEKLSVNLNEMKQIIKNEEFSEKMRKRFW